MENNIIIVGGGGHARVLIDLIRAAGQYDIVGVTDTSLQAGTIISGVPVLGDDSVLVNIFSKGVQYGAVGVGSVKDNTLRRHLFNRLEAIGFSIPILCHPSACITSEVKLERGSQIMARAVVGTRSSIGMNTIVNTSVVIEHDCQIGDHVHIASGSVLSGGVIVEDEAFIGAGSVVIQRLRIGRKSIVAAGAVVIRDVPNRSMVKGVPAV